jgi:hypothetical protein
MGGRRTLTIGVTINLEHYENLRLEVNGEAESVAEADSLVRFLDEILARLGREDPATSKLVDSYRRRVLSGSLTAESRSGAVSIPPLEKRPEEAATSVETSSGVSPDIREPAGPVIRQGVNAGATGSAPRDSSALSCENCGGSVSTAEQKMSQLFTGKTLCRACIKKVQG